LLYHISFRLKPEAIVRKLTALLGCIGSRRGRRSGQRSRDQNINIKNRIPVIIGRRQLIAPTTPADVKRVRTLTIVRRHGNLDAISDLHCGLMNVRSLGGGTADVVQERMLSDCIDAFVAVETWHDDASSPSLILACPTDYQFSECARPRTDSQANTVNTNHGGLAIYYRSSFNASRCVLPAMSSFECLGFKLTERRSRCGVTLLGSAAVTSEFFDELQLVVAAAKSPDRDLVVAGDLNIHVDVPSDVNAVQLYDILGDHGLRQHVRESTHNIGHTLNHVITSADCRPTSLVVRDLHVFHHSLVTFHVPVSRPSAQLKTFTSRHWSKFDISQFEQELATSELASTNSSDVDCVFQLYDNTIRTLLDKHAPPRTVRRRLRPESPWSDTECSQAKKKVRRLESVYYSRKSSVCHRIWRNEAVRYNHLLQQKPES